MNPEHRVFCSGTRQGTPLADRLGAVAAAGFTAVTAWPGDVIPVDRAALKASIRDHGLTLTDMECIGNWLPGHATAQGGWADALRGSTPEKIIALAAEMGAQSVSVVELMEQEWKPQVLARAFADLCDRAAENGLTAAIEHVPVGAVRDFSRARELVERADRPNAGIMVDSWHFFRAGSSFDALADCPGHLIHSVQLNDALVVPEADLNAGMMRRLLPGEGELDLKAFMQALAATGTTAPIGIETFQPELDALDTDSAVQRCAAALNYCLDLAR